MIYIALPYLDSSQAMGYNIILVRMAKGERVLSEYIQRIGLKKLEPLLSTAQLGVQNPKLTKYRILHEG